VIAEAAVVLSHEELGVLWTLADRPLFAYVPWPELDAATFEAVARGLLARGFIRDGDTPLMAPDVARLLDVAFFSDQQLRCTVNQFGPVDPATHQEVFWRRGETLVHHEPSLAGTHRFSSCDRSAIDATLREMFALPNAAGSQTGAPLTIAESEFIDALETVERDGRAVAAARYPALAGYLQVMADTLPMTSIEVRDSKLAGDELSLLDSPQHGLWMQRDGAGRTVVVQKVAAETAREHVAELVRMFG
jgi:hypothetical protein